VALIDQIAPDEGQARWHPLLIAHIVRLEEVEQGVLFDVDAIVEEEPADQRVDAYADGIEQHDLGPDGPPEPADV